MRSLSFEPLISPALWLTLVIVLVPLFAWYTLRRPAPVARLRWAGAQAMLAVAAALVLAVLLNPTWVEQLPPPEGKPLLTLLVDRSASMGTSDAGESGSRLNAAADVASDLADDLRDTFDVRLLAYSDAALPAAAEGLGAEADGRMTDVAAAIRSGVDPARSQGQAIVLLSDGIHNAGAATDVIDAVRTAKAFAAPVYTRTFGGSDSVRDVALTLRSAQEIASVQQTVPVIASVKRRGIDTAAATVVLREGDREIDSRRVMFGPDGWADVQFDLKRAEIGVYRYEVEVRPLPDEATDLNNREAFVLRIVDDAIRVVVLEGKPYWDGKFLMRTLSSDPAIELHSFVRLTNNRLMERTLRRGEGDAQPGTNGHEGSAGTNGQTVASVTGGADVRGEQDSGAAPAMRSEEWRIVGEPAELLARRDLLDTAQVLVLGRDAEVFLSDEAMANVRDWVARTGGSLVCYRGAPTAQVNQRLDRLLPVRWAPARESRFRVALTDRGRDLNWVTAATDEDDALSQLPTLATMRRVEQPKPLSVVLARSVSPETGEPFPVVVFQPYGSGRVVVIEGAGMWRWAFLAPQFQAHDDVYRGLWQSLLRWLVSNAGLPPGQNVALRADKVSFSEAERPTATLLLREEAFAERLPTIELSGTALDRPQTFVPTPLGDEPGTFRVVFGPLPQGRYDARVVAEDSESPMSRAQFEVRGFLEEKLDLAARPDLMARIAEVSGGAVLGDDPAAQVREHFGALMKAARPPRVQRTSAWDRWWVLGSAFALWTGGWAIRRSSGLI